MEGGFVYSVAGSEQDTVEYLSPMPGSREQVDIRKLQRSMEPSFLIAVTFAAFEGISLFGSRANCSFFAKRSPPHASQSQEFFRVCDTASGRISSKLTASVVLLDFACCTGFRFLSSTNRLFNGNKGSRLRSNLVIVFDKRRRAGEAGSAEDELLSLSESTIAQPLIDLVAVI